MVAKKVVIGLSVTILALSIIIYCAIENSLMTKETPKVEETNTKTQQIVFPQKQEPKYDLYSSTLYDLPFYSIVEISKLAAREKKVIDELLEKAQGFYFLKIDDKNNKIIALLQNPVSNNNTYARHSLEVVEISLETFEKHTYPLGYSGEVDEIIYAVDGVKDKSDNWNFNKSAEPYLPLKHKKYNEKGKLLFTEKWDYSAESEIKYQMKNHKGKLLSQVNETVSGESNFRKEHVFYDETGKLLRSININYDGANITRFTFYDIDNPQNNQTIISEYQDGLKVREEIFNENYEKLYTLNAEYKNGERKCITLIDREGDEILKICS